MIDEILSPPAFIALTAVMTTAAVAWAVHKSRAEKLDATQRANDQQVEALHQEIQRLSTVPPPPVTLEPSGRVSAFPPDLGAYSLVHRDPPVINPGTSELVQGLTGSIEEPFEYQGSIIPPPPASIRSALETLPGVGIVPKKTSRVG